MSLLLGILLFILPFVSFETLIPVLNFDKYLNTSTVWLNGLAIVIGIGAVITYFLNEATEKFFKKISEILSTNQTAIFLIIPILLGVLSYFVFNAKPVFIDAIVQLFQAQIFATGKVMADPVKYSEFFMGEHILFEPNGIFSQYPPGYPLLLAPLTLLGIPNVTDILLSACSALLIYKASKNFFGKQTGIIALLILIFSPYFLCLGVSFMNHIPALTGSSLVLYALSRIWDEKETNKAFNFLILGLGLGLIFICRPLSGLVLGFASTALIFKRLNFKNILVLGTTVLAVSSIFFIFNWLTLGDPFLPGYIKLWGANHGMGFHKDPWGETHTLGKGIALQLYNIFLLNEYLIESPLPALYLIAVPLIFGIKLNKAEAKLALLFVVFPLIYIFYWHQDSFMGPRFLYEGLAFLVPLLASVTYRGFKYFSEKNINLSREVNMGNLWRNIIVVALIISLLNGIPARIGIYFTSKKSMKQDLLAEAQKAGITNGIIFISTSWGDRIISLLRGSGVSASLVEEAYRSVDHCQLWELISRHRRSEITVSQLEADIVKRIESHEALEKTRWNQDPTLRINLSIPLTESCRNEIEYDLKDNVEYTIYSPHLLSNHGSWNNDLLFVRDLRGFNSKMLEEYPGRIGYFYRGGRFKN